jgi:ferritin-like metal-binding protein YciE
VRDLLLHELGKLLAVEEALARRLLPKLLREVKDEGLGTAISEHLEQTRGHVTRLHEAFDALGETPAGVEPEGLTGLKEEREATVEKLMPALRDGFNASAAMGTEHYEIASYEAAIGLAGALGADAVTGTLRGVLAEEVQALEKLRAHGARLAEQGATKPALP